MQPLLASTAQIAATLSPIPSAASLRDHYHRNPQFDSRVINIDKLGNLCTIVTLPPQRCDTLDLGGTEWRRQPSKCRILHGRSACDLHHIVGRRAADIGDVAALPTRLPQDKNSSFQ